MQLLPRAVLSRLQQNLLDNAGRMESMASESTAIQSDFQNAGLTYAMVKGLFPMAYLCTEVGTAITIRPGFSYSRSGHSQSTKYTRGERVYSTCHQRQKFGISHKPK